MDEPTATERTEGTGTVPVQPYVLEADRLAGSLPAKDADRLRFYKARSPLGDAEFYLTVVDLAPAHRDRLERLREEMARVFAVKGKIPKRLGQEVQAIMRQDRALRPPAYHRQ